VAESLAHAWQPANRRLGKCSGRSNKILISPHYSINLRRRGAKHDPRSIAPLHQRILTARCRHRRTPSVRRASSSSSFPLPASAQKKPQDRPRPASTSIFSSFDLTQPRHASTVRVQGEPTKVSPPPPPPRLVGSAKGLRRLPALVLRASPNAPIKKPPLTLRSYSFDESREGPPPQSVAGNLFPGVRQGS